MALIASKYAYEAFGADVATASPIETAYRYTAAQADAVTGGYYLRARYMSPGSGRFLSVDPLLGRLAIPISQHRFLYSEDSPVSKSERTTSVKVPPTSMATA